MEDRSMKKFLITVNGNQYEVDVDDITDTSVTNITRSMEKVTKQQPENSKETIIEKPEIKKPAQQAPAAKKAGTEIISCPMPGTILKVPVKIGQEVKKSQVLCILEAMKMENEIVSPRDGVIADVMATTGSSVNAGDPLVSLE